MESVMFLSEAYWRVLFDLSNWKRISNIAINLYIWQSLYAIKMDYVRNKPLRHKI